MARFKAVWTGKFPNLCSGEWKLYDNGNDISNMIPQILRSCPMDTLTYSKWHFNDCWDVTWEEYESGLNVDDWVQANKDWIEPICGYHNYEDMNDLFFAFQKQDWRYGSCGGCI